MKTKLATPHISRCYAVHAALSGMWSTPWILDDRPTEWRDRAGRVARSRGHRFLRFRCNDTKCPAVMLVLECDVAKQLPVCTSARSLKSKPSPPGESR